MNITPPASSHLYPGEREIESETGKEREGERESASVREGIRTD